MPKICLKCKRYMSFVGCLRCEQNIDIKKCKHCGYRYVGDLINCEECGKSLISNKRQKIVNIMPKEGCFSTPFYDITYNKKPILWNQVKIVNNKIQPIQTNYEHLDYKQMIQLDQFELGKGLTKLRYGNKRTKHDLALLAGHLENLLLSGHLSYLEGDTDHAYETISTYTNEIKYLIEKCNITNIKLSTYAHLLEPIFDPLLRDEALLEFETINDTDKFSVI